MLLRSFTTRPDNLFKVVHPGNRTLDIWALGHSPINLQELKTLSTDYPYKSDKTILINGFSNGFRIPYVGPRVSRCSNNMVSANEHSDQIHNKINTEVLEGRMCGPFSSKPISNLQVSPIGVVPKSDGGWRLITHLSYPPSRGINDFIDSAYTSVQYTSFDQVVDKIAEIGSTVFLAKMDLKNAFRLLPIYPGDFDLMGIKLNDKYYIDKCLPMGCSISCRLFEMFSSFLEWAVSIESGNKTLSKYLDDFIFYSDTYEGCCHMMSSFRAICSRLSVPIKEEKTTGPSKCIVFLGLEIDTTNRLIRVPHDKLQHLKALLININARHKITLRELQSLIGSLNFVCRAIRPGRAFNRRLYDALCKAKKPYHFIRITQEMHLDLAMWLNFLDQYNGVSFFPHNMWLSNDTLNLFTDSAGSPSLGCGAYYSGRWLFLKWSDIWPLHDADIFLDMTFLELVPVYLAFSVWGTFFKHHKIVLQIDNLSLVAVLNKFTSKSTRVMSLIRPLLGLIIEQNIICKARHIPGKCNDIADSLSRQQWERFKHLAPLAESRPTVVPDQCIRLLCSLK